VKSPKRAGLRADGLGIARPEASEGVAQEL